MTVGIVGSGPGAQAVEAALGDTDVSVARIDPEELGSTHRLAVVVALAGSRTFQLANERALAAGVPWVGVELGGIGGYPVVDAAVAGFEPGGACYECLVSRVASNVARDAEPVPAPADATARVAGARAGHRAVSFLEASGSAEMSGVVELPHAERELLPVPGCDCGETRDRTLGSGSADRSVEDALGRAERALDARLGVIATVGEAESYPAPYYLAQLCETSAFADGTAPRQAAGVDPGWDAAFMKALGEGLERYCAGVWRRSEFRTAEPAALDRPVPPSAFVRPDDWTTGEATGAAERPWVPGENRATGEQVQVPAELVHYPPPERTIRPAVTTGLGLGNSAVEAILSGLYEVVERDAATIAWYSSYEPLGLAVEDEAYNDLAARAGAEGLDASALLLTQDVDIPVVAVAVEHAEWPRLALGTAAHLEPARAARGALAEAVQNWVELREMGHDDAVDADGAIGRYADRPPAVAGFVDPDSRVPAKSVGPETVPAGTTHLAAVRERVTAANLTPYAVRTTTRDVRDLGFEAVRVLVPRAQPLFFGDAYFGERASAVPQRLGFEPRLDQAHHPYP
jgi:ribosomal protein S12 methylthiotransferase accessory factor